VKQHADDLPVWAKPMKRSPLWPAQIRYGIASPTRKMTVKILILQEYFAITAFHPNCRIRAKQR
jgi:hypothetical protein